MSTSTELPASIDPSKLASFHEHLLKSRRVLALLGAGLSASSGLPTFRGAGGLWRTHQATDLATPEAFAENPGFVWQFYSYRRHMALNAKPNRAHLALAEYARRNPDFITLSQNVDGLSPRCNHPEDQLKLLHGNLFDVKCTAKRVCGYIESNNFTDPIVPALAIPKDGTDLTARTDEADADTDTKTSTETAPQANTHPLIHGYDISSAKVPIATIPKSDLPHCPSCQTRLLRPGVVWFGESLPSKVLHDVSQFLQDPAPVDLMLVIGTSSTVFPAASYIELAQEKGAKVAIVNLDEGVSGAGEGDWFFGADAAVIVPLMLEPITGRVGEFIEGGDRRARAESFQAAATPGGLL